jgi:hypothetical protein
MGLVGKRRLCPHFWRVLHTHMGVTRDRCDQCCNQLHVENGYGPIHLIQTKEERRGEW